MNTDPTDTSGILCKAADVIDERGWHQGFYGHPSGKVCVLGAVSVAAGLGPFGLSRFDKTAAGMAAMEAGRTFGRWLGGISPSQWNDAEDRTVEDVTTALRECAAELAVVTR